METVPERTSIPPPFHSYLLTIFFFFREDIQQLRENYVIVDANQKCELCKYPTLTRTFYVFPCGHSFHGDCLEEEVQPYLTREQNIILTNLRTKLMQFETPTMNNQPANSGGEFGLSAISDALSFSPPKFTFFDDGPSAAPVCGDLPPLPFRATLARLLHSSPKQGHP